MCRSSAERERCITTTHEIATSAAAAPRTARLHSTHRPTHNALILHPVAPASSAGTAAKIMQRRGYASPVAAGTARQHAVSHPRSLAVQCSFLHLAAEAIPRPGERAMPPHPFALRKICSLQAESKSKMRRLV